MLPPFVPVAGLLLTGGQSTRMGQDKAALRCPDGRTAAQRVADTLRHVTQRVVEVGRAPFVLADHVPDRAGGRGPLAAVADALHAVQARQYLVCAADAPAVTPLDLWRLLGAPADQAVFVHDGRPLVLPLLVHQSVRGAAQRELAGGRRALSRLLDLAPTAHIPVDAATATRLRGANTPAEWAALYERMRDECA